MERTELHALGGAQPTTAAVETCRDQVRTPRPPEWDPVWGCCIGLTPDVRPDLWPDDEPFRDRSGRFARRPKLPPPRPQQPPERRCPVDGDRCACPPGPCGAAVRLAEPVVNLALSNPGAER